MNETELSMIPIDGRVEDFRNHLINNARTILSARFGDGKSFFLNRVIETSAEDTTYIVVHPVHYQVSENKDIFELVKRDILLQMIGQGMIAQDYEIPEYIRLSFYLQYHTTEIGKELLKSLFQIAPHIISALPDEHCKTKVSTISLPFILEGIKTIKGLWDNYQEHTSETNTEKILENFFKDTDKLKNSPIESDAITAIVRENIKKWKEDTDKRVVLVFEDMDRLDPAHLFRIMNVLSAQIDANCTIEEHNSGKLQNRFGVDNVVLILDYENLRNIFHHFYGAETNFKGYIHKFAPKEYFRYSLKGERHAYLMERLCQATGLTVDVLTKLWTTDSQGQKATLSSILEATDLRKTIHSMEGLEYGIRPEARYENIILSEGLLKLIVFLRRLMSDEMTVASLLKPLITPQTRMEIVRTEYLQLFKLSIRDISRSKAENPTIFLRSNNNKIYHLRASLLSSEEILLRELHGGSDAVSWAVAPYALINNLFKYIYANGSR